MVSLSEEPSFFLAEPAARGTVPHRRYNLSYIAALLNGGRNVFAPGFNGQEPRGQRIRQLAGTCLQMPKAFLWPSAVEISGPLSNYGPINIAIQPARIGTILSQLMAGHPSIVVRGARGNHPLKLLCGYLGVDAVSSMKGRILDNPILVFECIAQGQPAFVHLGVGSPGLKAVARHRDGLRRLTNSPLPPALRAATASIIETPQARAGVLVQTKVPGHALPLKKMPQDAVQQYIERTLDMVLSLSAAHYSVPNGPDDVYIRENLSTLGARVPSQYAADVMPAVEAVTRWPGRENLPASLVHGDLWLSNVLFSDGGKPVGLVDWEWSRGDGLPAFDALQLVCGTLAASRNLPIATVLTQVWDESAREPWVAAMLERIRLRLHLDQDALVRTALVLWLGIIRRSAIDTTGTSPDWFAKNVAAPAQSLATSGALTH